MTYQASKKTEPFHYMSLKWWGSSLRFAPIDNSRMPHPPLYTDHVFHLVTQCTATSINDGIGVSELTP